MPKLGSFVLCHVHIACVIRDYELDEPVIVQVGCWVATHLVLSLSLVSFRVDLGSGDVDEHFDHFDVVAGYRAG